MTLLSKTEVSKCISKFVDVDVPQWGCTVRLAELSAAARDRLTREAAALKDAQDNPSLAQYQTLFVAHCLVDEAGEPVFTYDELKKRSYQVVASLYDKLDELMLLSPERVGAETKN